MTNFGPKNDIMLSSGFSFSRTLSILLEDVPGGPALFAHFADVLNRTKLTVTAELARQTLAVTEAAKNALNRGIIGIREFVALVFLPVQFTAQSPEGVHPTEIAGELSLQQRLLKEPDAPIDNVRTITAAAVAAGIVSCRPAQLFDFDLQVCRLLPAPGGMFFKVGGSLWVKTDLIASLQQAGRCQLQGGGSKPPLMEKNEISSLLLREGRILRQARMECAGMDRNTPLEISEISPGRFAHQTGALEEKTGAVLYQAVSPGDRLSGHVDSIPFLSNYKIFVPQQMPVCFLEELGSAVREAEKTLVEKRPQGHYALIKDPSGIGVLFVPLTDFSLPPAYWLADLLGCGLALEIPDGISAQEGLRGTYARESPNSTDRQEGIWLPVFPREFDPNASVSPQMLGQFSAIIRELDRQRFIAKNHENAKKGKKLTKCKSLMKKALTEESADALKDSLGSEDVSRLAGMTVLEMILTVVSIWRGSNDSLAFSPLANAVGKLKTETELEKYLHDENYCLPYKTAADPLTV